LSALILGLGLSWTAPSRVFCARRRAGRIAAKTALRGTVRR
jgi:hypothetical protein